MTGALLLAEYKILLYKRSLALFFLLFEGVFMIFEKEAFAPLEIRGAKA